MRLCAILTKPDQWCRGMYGRTRDGRPRLIGEEAHARCIVSWIRFAYPTQSARDRVYREIRAYFGWKLDANATMRRLMEWQDASKRVFEDIRRVLEVAAI